MTLHASGHLQAGVAPPDQLLAARQQRCRCTGRQRRGVGQLQPGEMPRNLKQIGVGQRVDQLRHQPIAAPAFAEIEQLVVEIALRLAGQPWIEPIGRGAALATVATGAGQRALGQGVLERGGCQIPRYGPKQHGQPYGNAFCQRAVCAARVCGYGSGHD